MNDENSAAQGRRRAGQLIFAGGLVLVGLLLVAVLPEQTVWKARTKLFAQPRFWPAIGVFGMALFGLLHLRAAVRQLGRRRPIRADWLEARRWLEVLEFAGWFMVYVWLVPLLGYLPVTLAFAVALSWRLGYRSARMLWIAAVFGLIVVLVFKSFLQVKIPGALVYEYLPGALRSFFILNF